MAVLRRHHRAEAAELEQKRLISELQDALANIRTLRGLLPLRLLQKSP